MQAIKQNKQYRRRVCTLLFGLGIIFLGTVFCGRGVPIPYSQLLSPATGQCQSNNAAPVVGEETLALAVTVGPNIAICILRASDGLLLRHYDLDVHGDLVGQSDGLLFVRQRDGSDGNAVALCAIQINSGLTRWCQTQLKNYSSNFSPTYVPSTFATRAGRLYLWQINQADSFLTAVNEQTGQVLWNVRANIGSSTTHYSLALGQGIIYSNASQILPGNAPSPSARPVANGVCALQTETGQQLWCKNMGSLDPFQVATDEQGVYALASDASLTALSTNGVQRWQTLFPQSQPIYTSPPPIVAHGIVLSFKLATDPVSSATRGVVEAVRASDGAQLWSAPQPADIFTMTSTDQFLFVATVTGNFTVYNLHNGTQVWSRSVFKYTREIGPNILIQHDTAYLYLAGGNASSDLYETSSAHVLALHMNGGTTFWDDQGCARATPTPSGVPTGTPASANMPCSWTTIAPDGINSRFQLLQFGS